MTVTLTRNHYQSPKQITWNDMIDKLSYEFDNEDPKCLINPYTLPTFVCHTDYYPGFFLDAFNEVKKFKEMHVYCSLGRQAPTFGKHKDDIDVLIVQAFGKMMYRIDKEYILNPGDSLFIPADTYHEPYVNSPRITLSFSN
jgi:ribosomal protein L16 Arg81 hydroxylase